jgi:nuclear transcription factor Y gamma
VDSPAGCSIPLPATTGGCADGSPDPRKPPPLQFARLAIFWRGQWASFLKPDLAEAFDAPSPAADFKALSDLPIARIKRIMKSDEDVRMISAEAPVLFAKACELFISDLTMRSFAYTSEDKGKRRTLTREDVCLAVQQTDVFDFLVTVLMPGAWGWSGRARALATLSRWHGMLTLHPTHSLLPLSSRPRSTPVSDVRGRPLLPDSFHPLPRHLTLLGLPLPLPSPQLTPM